MKLKLFAIIAYIMVAGGVFAGTDYRVTVRDDNDIATFIDTLSKQVPAPEAVNTKLKNLLTKKLTEGRIDTVQMYTYWQTFRVTTPDSDYVFIAEIDEGLRGLQFYLFYFNTKKNSCSDYMGIDGYFMKNDEEGFADWNGKLIDKPYISFKDLGNDGVNEIIFKRRAHNGTWNAEETIVFNINNKGQIVDWFAYYSKEIKTAETEILIKRKIREIEGHKLILGVSTYDFNSGKFLRKSDDEVHIITGNPE